MPGSIQLKQLLADNTMPAAPELVRAQEEGALECLACGHRCVVKPGRTGVCRVRFNEGGQLRVPAGYVAGLQVDPIEKKPFYHAYPGREAFSFGMLGCDYHCSFCQNWISSQVLRDEAAVAFPTFCSAERLVELAVEHRVPVMVSTYNEPLITADWAVDIFKLATAAGIACGFVSNGNATPAVLEFIRPYVSLYKVDLKGFDDKKYRLLGGVLQVVLDTIRRLKEMDFWVEVVTLVVPGLNDGNDELRRLAEFLAGVSVDIPWHVTAFHPDYKMGDTRRTPSETLARAAETGTRAGLRYVYAGNLPGGVGDREHTYCHSCGARLISRVGFSVRENRMQGSACYACGTRIPGVWEVAGPDDPVSAGRPRPVRP
ncbi:MAG TPA: AmmeMemoRadiSam system radical SAM enzyme [Phycisphaerae bacterium]|nr:AmmeMemoRadiSam system radical SAM enzyme [Phycisphaerae bacterium]HNU45991.1 AmmeMemoRadiSam system radical SAM enzyme [Phycisphaerae bacterium]